MCWFSAHEMLSTRNAIEGEELVVQDFSEAGRRWVASPEESEVAVCLPGGSNLRLTGIPKDLRELLNIGPEAIAEFRENYQRPRPFLQRLAPPEYMHDVLVFEGGSHLPLRMLPVGTKIDALSPAVASPVGVRSRSRVSDPVPLCLPWRLLQSVKGAGRDLSRIPPSRLSLAPERAHRINSRRPPSGDITCEQRDPDQNQGDDADDQGIGRPHSVQQIRQEPCQADRPGDA